MDTLPLAIVSQKLQVSHNAIRTMCRLGKLPGAFKVGKRWLINRETFDQWLEKASISGPGRPIGNSDGWVPMGEKYAALLGQKTTQKR